MFFPLLVEREYALIGRMLGLPVDEAVEPIFESESTLEVAKRKTSFDFHLRDRQRDEHIFVEVNYTEDGFAAAAQDEEHRQKFVDTYAPLVQGSPFLERACGDCGFFLRNYQVLRNLVHVTAKSHVVLLFPRANVNVAKQAEEARKAFLTDSGRSRVHLVYLEDATALLTSEGRSGRLDGYYETFKEKYLGFSRYAA